MRQELSPCSHLTSSNVESVQNWRWYHTAHGTLQCRNADGGAGIPPFARSSSAPAAGPFPVKRCGDRPRRPHSQLSVVAPESYPCASSQRSASIAAAQPVPAAVTACR
jgi:hypothetical protein